MSRCVSLGFHVSGKVGILGVQRKVGKALDGGMPGVGEGVLEGKPQPGLGKL